MSIGVCGKNRFGKWSLSSLKDRMSFILAGLFVFAIFPAWGHSAEKLIVKDTGGAATFSVAENGRVFASERYEVQGQYPGFWLDETGFSHKGAYLVLGENWLQVQRRAESFGAYEASPLYVNIEAPNQAVVIDASGNVGLRQWNPAHPLHMRSGAYCSAGGVWTNASSREYKKDIRSLTSEEAIGALEGLTPVSFSYKDDSGEQHVGFIAEDVPDLVASKDRKGMSPMDVVAVLTRVVQEQQKTIAELSQKVAQLEKGSR